MQANRTNYPTATAELHGEVLRQLFAAFDESGGRSFDEPAWQPCGQGCTCNALTSICRGPEA